MKIAVVILLATLVASTAGVQPSTARVRLFPYGSSAGDSNLGATDDGSTTRRMSPFKFYGSSYTTVRIYNNGYLGLSSSYVGGHTPRRVPYRHGVPMIASYWADHDARYGSGRTWFRVSTRYADLKKAAQLVRCAYGYDITPRQVVVVTWFRLGYYNRHTDKLNTHQTVLVTDGRYSYVLFLYQDINWTTGDVSHGRNGYGGTRAWAGLNRGDGTRYVTIPTSGTHSILNIETTSNVQVRGLYVFRTDPTSIRLNAPSRRLFPYGECANDAHLPATDDGYRQVNSGTVRMYGRTYTSTKVYNNGYLSFGSGTTGGYTPRPFPYRSNNHIMVAPYWADVDTRSGDGCVYYRRTTDYSLRSRAGSLVRRIYGVSFTPTSLFIVTWSRVGHYNRNLYKRNTYQCVLATNRYHTFIIFLYGGLQWTTGRASGGRNGLGGHVARGGINAGDGSRSINIPGSGVQSRMLSLTRQSNIAYAGIYVLYPTAMLYPRGSTNLGAVDDRSRQVSFHVPFYGRTLSTANICNNGYISLGTSYCRYTPRRYPMSTPMVAPYWADADSNVGSGRTYYQVTTTPSIRQRVRYEVEATQNVNFYPTRVLIVTWFRLGYYNNHQDKLNTFQAVIATDGRRTYTIYNYEDINWTTGDSSGGRNGYGGTVARAGNNGGVGGRHVTLPHSGNQGRMLNLESATNVRMPGVYILQAHPAVSAAMVEDAPVLDVEFQEVDKSMFENAPLADEEVNSLAEELDNLAEPYMEEKMEIEEEFQGDKGVEVDEEDSSDSSESDSSESDSSESDSSESDSSESDSSESDSSESDSSESDSSESDSSESDSSEEGEDMEDDTEDTSEEGKDMEDDTEDTTDDAEDEEFGYKEDDDMDDDDDAEDEEFGYKGVEVEEEFQGDKGVEMEQESPTKGEIEEKWGWAEE